jgi:hypothetical protein
MDPRLRSTWRSIHAVFTGVMWLIAAVIAMCVIGMTSAAAAAPHAQHLLALH